MSNADKIDDDGRPAIYVWVGEDENYAGEIGVKQGWSLSGHLVALFSVNRHKIGADYLVEQLQRQANLYRKPMRLVRYEAVETLVEIEPEHSEPSHFSAWSPEPWELFHD